MEDKRFDFTIQEAGCLIWIAPRDFAGFSPDEVGRAWMGDSDKTVQELVTSGALMPMSLYQDDGYVVRFVLGELTEQERSEWTARAVWQLDVSCGQVLISGVLSDELEDDLEEMMPAREGSSYLLGCYADVPPGKYRAEVYSYPPGDLSTGWGQIEGKDYFPPSPGIETEKPLDYFRRTRPGEEPPVWIAEDYDLETFFVNFIVRLSPLAEELPPPEFEADGCIRWEFRKPDICPVGIESTYWRADG